MTQARSWQAPESCSGERLDRYLARELSVPRNQIQRWIRQGLVRLEGRPAKPSHLLMGGEHLECEAPPSLAESQIRAEPGEVPVLYEDPHLVVVDKPAGLTVHPGAGRSGGTLAHFVLSVFPEMAEVGGPGRPGIVHRLDKGTSGVMVLARTAEAYQRLAAAFAARRVVKSYLALVYGVPEPETGRIEAPIGRHRIKRKQMSVRPDGRAARSDYRTVANAGGLSVLEIDLATGRTHQIRVHLKTVGHPLVGDSVYGEARWKGFSASLRPLLREFPRPALHAWRLAFDHPSTEQPVRFEAPIPEDLKELWRGVTGGHFPGCD